MLLYILNHPYHYELENLCRVFLPALCQCFASEERHGSGAVLGHTMHPSEKIQIRREPDAAPKPGKRMHVVPSIAAVTQIKNNTLTVTLYYDNHNTSLQSPITENNELMLAQMLFTLLKRATGYSPPWGLLTGVRPSKLMLHLRRDENEPAARRYFRDTLWVSEEKTALAAAVAQAEEPILARTKKNSFSLYLSIPFCPSRCAYCSFVSHTVDRQSARALIPSYVERLCEEIAHAGRLAKELDLRLESVYIGGGTPTTLTAEQSAQVCGALQAHFDMQACEEFTVEAGRSDTITEEKLLVLREHGVNRLSINPQSMIDEVLALAGRKHTAEDCLRSFALARELGFDNINMDLIAGLPGDCPDGFRYSLETLIGLKPENITVHTLALKRSATLQTQDVRVQEEGISEMLRTASTLLPAAGYAPYYMYRQSRSLGNLENIGWAMPGHACRYNIDMMEESHTILACGAGGVTKCKQWGTDYLERVFSLKYPYEYLARFDELMERKERIKAFYDTYNK